MHIVELQHKLDEAQGKNSEKIRSYTASARCQKDIESLSKIGLSHEDISRSLDLSTSFVKNRIARIERENSAKRRFLTTGHIEEELETPGYFAILQK